MIRVTKFLLAAIFVTSLCGCANPADTASIGRVTAYASLVQPPEIGTPAPDFTYQTPESQSSLSRLKGKSVLLNFWKIDCPPCIAELPYIQQIYKEWEKKGLTVLTVNLGESETAVRDFLTSRGYSFPVLLDNPATGLKYTGNSYPVSILIDDKGITRSVKLGAYASKEEIEKEIADLAEPANYAPQMAPLTDIQADEGAPVEFTVAATDPNGEKLTFSASSLPTGATLDPATGAFSWETSVAGNYTGIRFDVTDGKLTDSRTIDIIIARTNHPPVFQPITDKRDWADEYAPVSFKVVATDPDGDELTVSATNLPNGAKFDPETGEFSWTPSPAGEYKFTFEATDGEFKAAQDVSMVIYPAVSESSDSGGGDSCDSG